MHDVMTAIKLFKCNYKCSQFSTGMYTRGLERWSDTGKTTHKRRQIALWAVLDEQYQQCLKAEKQGGDMLSYLIYDDNKFREVYSKHTYIASDIAYSMGRIDELSALNCYSTPPEKKSNRRRKRSSSNSSSSSSNDGKKSTAGKDTTNAKDKTFFRRTTTEQGRRLRFTTRHVLQVSPIVV